MLNQIKKGFYRRFNFQVYNFYTADLSLFTTESKLPENISGFTILHDKATVLERFFKSLPAQIVSILSNIIYEKGLYCCSVISSDSRLANYIFYYKHTRIVPRETKRELILKDDAVFMIAGRTIPGYEGLRLSEYGKRNLFFLLQEEGFKYAYLMARKKNPVSNHVNQKIGIPLTALYYHLTLFRRVFVFKRNLQKHA